MLNTSLPIADIVFLKRRPGFRTGAAHAFSLLVPAVQLEAEQNVFHLRNICDEALSRRTVVSRLRAALLLSGALVPLAPIGAQAAFTAGEAQAAFAIRGVVTDSSGAPVAGATLAVAGSAIQSTTDDAGHFRLGGIPAGQVTLRVRRLGFAPLDLKVTGQAGESLGRLQLTLAQLPTRLGAVLVRSARMEHAGRLGGYYSRLHRRAGGTFISREQIDKKSAGSLSQLLRTVPGINAFPLRSGGSAVRMRGRGCRPIVWLDGVALPAAEVDLDAFPTSTLQGIELYLGSTNAPSDFPSNGVLSGCGTILLWSRGPETEPARPRPEKRVDLARLVESLVVFSAEQVDRQAQLANSAALDVAYPPDLFAEAVSGAVVAEFVVDSSGKVEAGTFSIVTSSNPRFSHAVERAVQNAIYVPAVKDGRPVRQAVQQPFSFVPGSRNPAQGAR